MKKIFLGIAIILVLLINVTFVYAHAEDFTKTKGLIDSEISCDKLSDEQLDEIGDYYMEQMHPGEAHELMHEMMGGHDSETIKLMHINMARGIYCDEDVGMGNMMNMMSSGMMNGMMGQGNMMGGGMMDSGDMMTNNMMSGGGMMGNYYQNPQNSKIYQNSFFGFQIFFYIILTLIIITLILVIMLLINKSKNNLKQRGRNNRNKI